MSEHSAFSLKRLLVGKPIPSHLAHHQRLSKVTGLAVLSSDALSSVAYATDFILATLLVAGIGAFSYAVPISLVIAALLAVVAFSYRQTIHAYPTGGGAYIVAKENIGPNSGLIAASCNASLSGARKSSASSHWMKSPWARLNARLRVTLAP